MDLLALVGRILFVVPFLFSALGHVTKTDALAGYAASKRVPFPRAAVLGTGLLQIAGGLMVLLGVWADVGALLLVAFLLPTAVVMHDFWTVADPQGRQAEQIQFTKDIGLAGGALLAWVLFAYAGDALDLTITGPAFRVR